MCQEPIRFLGKLLIPLSLADLNLKSPGCVKAWSESFGFHWMGTALTEPPQEQHHAWIQLKAAVADRVSSPR